MAEILEDLRKITTKIPADRGKKVSAGIGEMSYSVRESIVGALVQIAQLLGLLHNGRHQHLGQNLVAGKLGGEPAAALRGLPDEGGKVCKLCQRHFSDDGLQAVLVRSMPSTRPRRLVTSPMISPVLSFGT